jgi:hypothetical protein
MRRILVGLLLLVAAAAFAQSMRTEAAGLRFTVPKEWTRVPAPSEMRAAQYQLPRAGGDAADGELIVFFFGKGKGGGTQENLDRWYGQITQPDGTPTRDKAVVTIRTVNTLKVSAVDVGGTYVGMPGMGGDAQPKPGWRMLACVVEGDAGPWFFKAVGPEKTIAQAKAGFDALVASLEAHQ